MMKRVLQLKQIIDKKKTELKGSKEIHTTYKLCFRFGRAEIQFECSPV